MDTPEAAPRHPPMVADAAPLRTSHGSSDTCAPDGPPPHAPTHTILFYDGDCGFCDRVVAWLVVRDRHATLRFAPLRGPTAAAVRASVPGWPDGIDSVVLFDGCGGEPRVRWRTAAVAGALARLPAPWPWVALVLRAMPPRWADLGYATVARVRRALAPPPDACALLPVDLRARFLP